VKFLKIKKTKVALIFASVCLIVAIGYTSAYYNSTVNVENKMATQEPEIELIEKFNQDSQFLPGETVDKKVKFANSGEIDALIRVSYSQSWINQNGDFVNGDVDSVEKKWTSAWQDEWVDGNDGYFYYTKVLKANTTTNIILDSLVLSEQVSNDTHAVDYSGIIYQITFNLESCKATTEGAQSTFGKTAAISGNNVTWSDYKGNSNQQKSGEDF